MTGPGPYSLATYCYFIGRITSCINGRNDLPEMLPFKETHKALSMVSTAALRRVLNLLPNWHMMRKTMRPMLARSL